MAVPMIGAALSGPARSSGRAYTGFLDELRLSRRFVEAPALARFAAASGTAVSRLVDLGTTATRVVRIETVQSTPADSALFYYYRLSDDARRDPPSADPSAGWMPFAPGAGLPEAARAAAGCSCWSSCSPTAGAPRRRALSSIHVVYEPHLPPLAPAGLVATPGNGKVTLSWRRVDDPEVKGYEVYYGTSPGSYFGEGAAQGASPLDAGDVTQLVITGLENGTLYYFAVAAYDGAAPRQRSLFCRRGRGPSVEDLPMKSMTTGEVLTRARNAFKMGEYPLVEKLALRILESEPDSAIAYNLLGSVCERTGRFRKAVELFQKAVELAPDSPESHNNLGVVLKRMESYGEAIPHFERAIELAPGRGDVYFNLGNVYKALGNDEAAEESFQKAIAVDPGFVPTYNNLGTVLEGIAAPTAPRATTTSAWC